MREDHSLLVITSSNFLPNFDMWSCVFLHRIFGHSGEAAKDVCYVNWLSMVRSGLLGLEYYTPELNKWRQASHSPAGGSTVHPDEDISVSIIFQ